MTPVVNTLTPNPSSPQIASTTVRWTASAYDPDGDPILYRFWLKGPSTGEAWQQVRDWSSTNFWDWTTSQPGNYEVNVWIRDGKHAGPDNWDAYKIETFTVSPAPILNRPPVFNSLTSNPPSPQTVGTPIRWIADATDPDPGDVVYYAFSLKGPSTGGAWQQVQDWSTKNWWDWVPSQQGEYEMSVWIRDGKHAGSDGWDAYKITPFKVNPAPVPNQPLVVTALSPNRPSPQTAGMTVRWTASAQDPDGDPILYRFWLKGPSTGEAWHQVRDWSNTNFWDWTTSQPGNYEVNVWIRDAKHAGPNNWDAYKMETFTVNPVPISNQPPVLTGFAPDRPSPQIAGTRITWTATANDPDGDPIIYRFWMKGPSTGNAWKVVRDWSTTRTWTWSTSPGDAGVHEFAVYVRDGKHQPAGRYDDVIGYRGYQLITVMPANQPPVVTALTPNRPSPQSAGSTVVWTATAIDPDRDTIFYKFWLRGPSTENSWKVVRDWSTISTWTWSTYPADAGAYDVYVYVRDGNHAPATSYDSARGYSGYQIRAPGGVRQLTSGDAVQDRPSLVFSDDGIVLAYQSWEAGALFRGDIFLKRFDPGWNLIQKVRATSDPTYQDTPSVIYSDGYYYVAYVSDETGNWDIFVKKYDRDLVLVEARKVTTSTADQDSPSLVRVGNDFYLAYQSWETGPSSGGDIFIERFNSAWSSTRKVRVTTEASYQDRPSLTIGGDDRLYVAYVSEETGNKDTFVKKYDRSLNSLEKMRLTTSPSVQDHPSLLWRNGVFNLVYSSQEGGSLDLYMERFDPGWSLIDRAQLTGTSGDEIWPSLAYSPFDGLLWVAYVHQDGPGGNIFVQPAISMDPMAICWASMEFSAARAYSPYSLTVRFHGTEGELADPSNLRLTWSPADAVLTSSAL